MLKRKIALVVLVVVALAAQAAPALANPGNGNAYGHLKGFSDGPR